MNGLFIDREYRKQVLCDIIEQLYDGKSVEDVREQFETAYRGTSVTEIAHAEGLLIAEGLPVLDVQHLCENSMAEAEAKSKKSNNDTEKE